MYWQLFLTNNFLALPKNSFGISGPTTVYEGDNISLTCHAGPSYSGKTIPVKLRIHISTYHLELRY